MPRIFDGLQNNRQQNFIVGVARYQSSTHINNAYDLPAIKFFPSLLSFGHNPVLFYVFSALTTCALRRKALEEFGEPIKNFRIPKFMIATSR